WRSDRRRWMVIGLLHHRPAASRPLTRCKAKMGRRFDRLQRLRHAPTRRREPVSRLVDGAAGRPRKPPADWRSWATVPVLDGALAHIVHACHDLDLEGVVLKRRGSPYRPGERSKDWIKVKTPDRREHHAARRHER